jgi:hypothetical protein
MMSNARTSLARSLAETPPSCGSQHLRDAASGSSSLLTEAQREGKSGSLFSYVDLEKRVPVKHSLRVIKSIVDEVLLSLDGEFAKLYEGTGRQSIAPERLLRASLLQAFYSVRSERQLMEQIDYNLLFRWFVGLGHRRPGLGPLDVLEEPRPTARCGCGGQVPGGGAAPPQGEAVPLGRPLSRSTAHSWRHGPA